MSMSVLLVVLLLFTVGGRDAESFTHEEVPSSFKKELVSKLRRGGGVMKESKFVDFLPDSSQVVGGILSKVEVTTTAGKSATYEVAAELPSHLNFNFTSLLQHTEDDDPLVLPGVTLTGPSSLLFHRRQDVALMLPHSVDAGLIRSIALEEEIAVTAHNVETLEVESPGQHSQIVKSRASEKSIYILEGEDVVVRSAMEHRLKAKRQEEGSVAIVAPHRQAGSELVVQDGANDISITSLMEIALQPLMSSPLRSTIKTIDRIKIHPIAMYRVAGAFGPIEGKDDEGSFYTVIAGVGIRTSDGKLRQFETTDKKDVSPLELSLALGSTYVIEADHSNALSTSVTPTYFQERAQEKVDRAVIAKEPAFVFTETLSPTVSLGNETLSFMVEAGQRGEVIPAERGLILKRRRDRQDDE